MIKRLIRLIGQQRHEYEKDNSKYYAYVCKVCGESIYVPANSEWQYRLREFKGCKGK